MDPIKEDIASGIWNDVLEAMPEDLHARYALVEARRWLIGMPDEGDLSRALDRLAVEAFGADQIAEACDGEVNHEMPARLSEAEVQRQVIDAVYDGFAATTDGSPERAQVLRQRAIGNAERVIEAHGQDLSWLARRRLRNIARKAADEEVGRSGHG